MNLRCVCICLFMTAVFGPGCRSITADTGQVVPLGPGFTAASFPENETGPLDKEGAAVSPRVVSDFDLPSATNDWWSSLIWSYDGNPYSAELFPHPLSMKANAQGLVVGLPRRQTGARQNTRRPCRGFGTASVVASRIPSSGATLQREFPAAERRLDVSRGRARRLPPVNNSAPHAHTRAVLSGLGAWLHCA